MPTTAIHKEEASLRRASRAARDVLVSGVTTSPRAAVVGTVGLLANLIFLAWGFSDFFHVATVIAVAIAATFLIIQVLAGMSIFQNAFWLGLFWAAVYCVLASTNIVLAGGGITAGTATDLLGKKFFTAAIAPAVKQIDAVSASTRSLATALNQVSTEAQSLAAREDSDGKTCAASLGGGRGDVWQIRMNDQLRMAALSTVASDLSSRLTNARLVMANSISSYSANAHERTVASAQNALAVAQQASRDPQITTLRGELTERLAQARGKPMVGPKSGRSIVCVDESLAHALEGVLQIESAPVPDASMPSRPDHEAAVEAFISHLISVIFDGADYDYATFGRALAGFFPDILVSGCLAQIFWDMRRKRGIIGSLVEPLGIEGNEPWSELIAAVDAARDTASVQDLERYHVAMIGLFNTEHFLAIPIGRDADTIRWIAQRLVVEGTAKFFGTGSIAQLIDKQPDSEGPLTTMVDIFKLGRGVWEAIRLEALISSARSASAQRPRDAEAASAAL